MGFNVHPTAQVQTEQIGDETVIWQNCLILEGAKIGNNCNINYNVFIEGDVVVGNNVTVKSGVQLWDGLRVGDDVFIGPNATFTNDLLPRSKHYPEAFTETIIEQGASIGANATIMAGNNIGRYAMIGAGSVVTKEVPPFTLWYGNPASMKGYVTRDGIPLRLDLKDKQGRSYKLDNQEPILNDKIPGYSED